MPDKSSRQTYPPGFTHLIAELADTAMKAVTQPDPVAYVEQRTCAERADLIRFRRALPASDRLDSKRQILFHRDIARHKLVRNLAIDLLRAFKHLERCHGNAFTPASALSLPVSPRATSLPIARRREGHSRPATGGRG